MSTAPDPSSPSLLTQLWSLVDVALPDLYGYLVARCGDPVVAQDLTMTVLEAAIEQVRRGGVDTLTTAWLIGIGRHKLVDHWRRLDADRRRQERLEQETPLAEDPWEIELERARTHEVLERLGAANRAALTLRYLDGLPVAEVAAALGRTIQATEALLTRARHAFRSEYERTEDDR